MGVHGAGRRGRPGTVHPIKGKLGHWVEPCPKCRKTAEWILAKGWKNVPNGTKLLWCQSCNNIVGGLKGEFENNPFRDEVDI